MDKDQALEISLLLTRHEEGWSIDGALDISGNTDEELAEELMDKLIETTDDFLNKKA